MAEDEVFGIEFIVGSNISQFSKDVAAAGLTIQNLNTKVDALNASMKKSLFVNQLGANLKSSGFNTTMVTANQAFVEFGKNLEKNRVKVKDLKDELKDFRNETTRTQSKISQLAENQVRMMQSSVVKTGFNKATGQATGMVIEPAQADLSAKMLYNNKLVTGEMMKQIEAQKIMEVAQNRVNQAIINSGKQWQWTGRQLTMGVSLPIVALGYAAAKAFKSVDEQLVNLTKVYGSAVKTGAALEQQNAQVRASALATAKQLAESWGQSAEDTIGLEADLAATGKEGNDLTKSTIETTRLMILGEVDKQDAMKTTLTLQSVFKVSTEDLANAINFFNAVENQTSLTLQDITEAMPKAGSAVKALGGDYKDLALYMSAMKEGGISAAEGANALKTSLARMVTPTKAAKDQLKVFGIDINSIIANNKGDITKMILALRDAIDKSVPESDKTAVYEKLFGKQQYVKMMTMFNNLEKNGSQSAEVLRLMGANMADLGQIAENELGTKTESASNKFKQAIESIRLQLVDLGEPILNAGNMILGVLQNILSFINSLPSSIKNALALGAVGAALLGPLVMIFGLFKNLIGVIKSIGLSIKTWITTGRGVTKEFQSINPEMIATEKLAKSLTHEMANTVTQTQRFRQEIEKIIEKTILLDTLLKAKAAGVLQTDVDLSKANLQYMRNLINSDEDLAPYAKQYRQMFGTSKTMYTKSSRKNLFSPNSYSIIASDDPNAKRGITTIPYGSIKNYNDAVIDQTNKLKDNSGGVAKNTAGLKENNIAVNTWTSKIKSGIKQIGSSKGGQIATGAALALGSMAIPDDSLGGFGKYLSGAGQGAGIGLAFGPYGAAIGAGLGVAKTALDQVNKSNEQFIQSEQTSANAAELFGKKIRTVADVELDNYAKKTGQTTDVVNNMVQAFSNLPEDSTEKAMASRIKDEDDNNKKMQLALDYFKNQVAEIGDDPQTVQNVKNTLAAMLTSIGQEGLIAPLNLKISEMNITNKDEARKQIVNQLKGSGYTSQHQGGPIEGDLYNTPISGFSGPNYKEDWKKAVSLLSSAPFNSTIVQMQQLDNLFKQSGVDLNALDQAGLEYYANQTAAGQSWLEATKEIQNEYHKATGQTLSFTDAQSALAAANEGLKFSIDQLPSGVGQATAYLAKLEAQTNATKTAFDNMMKTLGTTILQLASTAEKAQKQANKVMTPEQIDKQIDKIKTLADKRKDASDKAIDQMKDNFEAEEKAMSDHIDKVKKKYEDEIDLIQKKEQEREDKLAAAKEAADRANTLSNLNVDYQKAVYEGRFFDAQKAKNDMNTTQQQYSLDDQDSAAKKAAQDKIDKLKSQEDKEVAKLQKQLDAKKKADDQAIKSAQARAKAEQDAYQKEIDSLNKVKKKATEVANAQKKFGQETVDAINKDFSEKGSITHALLVGAQIMKKNGGDWKKLLAEGFAANGAKDIGNLMMQNLDKVPWKSIDDYIQAKARGDEAAAKAVMQMIQTQLNQINSGKFDYVGQKKASGGYIYGPGTGLSDSILAMGPAGMLRVANGEYIVRESVAKISPNFMNMLNSGAFNAALRRMNVGGFVAPAMNKYNSGGMVGYNSGGEVSSSAGSSSVIYNFHFGRTSASVRDIENVLHKVVQQERARVGSR